MTDPTLVAQIEALARTHNIKCWPEVFEEMLAGRKTAEFRLDDRGYRTGDNLLIREWCPKTKAYTHREITRTITHILREGFGVPTGYAMLSLSPAIVTALRQAEAAPGVVEEAKRTAQLCFERADTYGALRWTSLTAIALDRAANCLLKLTKALARQHGAREQ